MGDHIGARLQARDAAGNWRPKRILSLDGGGARGIVTIAFLEHIEAVLRVELKDEIAARGLEPGDFRLCHYFDLIGGTSVGALIATMLARGMSTAEIKKRFQTWSRDIFRPRRTLWFLWPVFGILGERNDSSRLRKYIHEIVGDERLDSASLTSGLVIVAKNARTGSVWVLSNNPFARYYNRDHANPATVANREFRLVDLLRASTAAPTFFKTQQLEIHRGPAQQQRNEPEDQTAWFVDGGVSPHNNPALQLFMMAGMKGYRLGGTASGTARRNDDGIAWPLGPENVLLVSVGTGRFDTGFKPRWYHAFPAFVAKDSLQSMIADGQKLALSMLQWLSNPSGRNWLIDREIGTLEGELLPHSPDPKALLSFVRYDIELKNEWLEKRENAGRWIAPYHLKEMIDFTNTNAQERLYGVASRAAARQVNAGDFPKPFKWLWLPVDAHPSRG